MRRLVGCQGLSGRQEKASNWLSEAVLRDTREGLELGCQKLLGTHEKARRWLSEAVGDTREG